MANSACAFVLERHALLTCAHVSICAVCFCLSLKTSACSSTLLLFVVEFRMASKTCLFVMGMVVSEMMRLWGNVTQVSRQYGVVRNFVVELLICTVLSIMFWHGLLHLLSEGIMPQSRIRLSMQFVIIILT